MSFVLLSLLFSDFSHAMGRKRCDESLVQKQIFSEYSIAKTLDYLGDDARVFVRVIHGMNYDKISAELNRPVRDVREIAQRGYAVLIRLKEKGL